jgi:hypothetical protein
MEKKKDTVKVNFLDLGIMNCEVEVARLTKARIEDKRGYAVFPATDSEGDEVAIEGINGNVVPLAILLNDTSVKSKGKDKAKRKILGS